MAVTMCLGYEVWVLPHLAENVIIEDVNTVALRLLQSFVAWL